MTNVLTGAGYGLSGSNLTVNLIDPYMGDGWDVVRNSGVYVNVFTGTRWDVSSMIVNWGAHAFGLGNRAVYQAGRMIPPHYMHVGHTQMDTYVPGAMGTSYFLGY